MDNVNTVGRTPLPSEVYTSGVGYVTLPLDIKREDYIKACYLQNRISIKTEDGGYYNRVPVDPWLFNFIEFPSNTIENGTMVCWIMLPQYNQPIIVGRVPKNDEISGLTEHQFKLLKKFGENFVELSGNPETSVLNLSVNSQTGGELNLNIYNKDSSGKLNISVLGDININATGSVSLTQNSSLSIQTSDPEDETSNSLFSQNEQENHFQNEIFTINSGSEPMVLGNQTKQFLSDFIDEVANITVTTSLGQMPILNKAQVLNLKTRLDDLLSEIGYLE